MTPPNRRLAGVWLGRRRYHPVHELQRALQTKRRAGSIGDTVLFVEHEPVITLGRGAHSKNLLSSREALAGRGVDLVETGRGGDVTVHAPGQLVVYPIIDLAPDRCDVRRYVRDLTETMRRLAAEFGIDGGEFPRYIGLWVDKSSVSHWPGADSAQQPAKLGAIGVSISRWVTMHGFAFNVFTDPTLFQLIVPCGIREFGVTSVADLSGQRPNVESCARRAFPILAEVLGAAAGPFTSDTSPELPAVFA